MISHATGHPSLVKESQKEPLVPVFGRPTSSTNRTSVVSFPRNFNTSGTDKAFRAVFPNVYSRPIRSSQVTPLHVPREWRLALTRSKEDFRSRRTKYFHSTSHTSPSVVYTSWVLVHESVSDRVGLTVSPFPSGWETPVSTGGSSIFRGPSTVPGRETRVGTTGTSRMTRQRGLGRDRSPELSRDSGLTHPLPRHHPSQSESLQGTP